jgi:hypothetical protein
MTKLEKIWNYEDKKYIFTMPTVGQSNAADLEFSKAYTEAVKNGLMPRTVLERDFKEKGIWTDEDNKKLEELLQIQQEQILALKLSGEQDKKEQLKIDLLRTKLEFQELYTQRQVIFQHSADSKGDAARILELAWRCIFNENREQVWKTKEALLEEQDSKFISSLITELVIFTSGLEDKVNSLEDFIEEVTEKVDAPSSEENKA